MRPMTSMDWNVLTLEKDALLQRLIPICRSITGDGLRRTLSQLRETTDFQLHEVPTSTICYNWTIPDEWNIREAFVDDSAGRRLIDFQQNDIHLVNYNILFVGALPYDELISHLHTLPEMSSAIRYWTTYYNWIWCFCLSYEKFQDLDRKGKYHVAVDTTLSPGALTYDKAILSGLSGKDFLISTFVYHPSLANDNLSGVVL